MVTIEQVDIDSWKQHSGPNPTDASVFDLDVPSGERSAMATETSE